MADGYRVQWMAEQAAQQQADWMARSIARDFKDDMTPGEKADLYRRITEFTRHHGPQMTVHIAENFGLDRDVVARVIAEGAEEHFYRQAVARAERERILKANADKLWREEQARKAAWQAETDRINREVAAKAAATRKIREDAWKAGLKDGVAARDELICQAYALEGRACKKIGERFGLSGSRVNQIVSLRRQRHRALFAKWTKKCQGASYPFDDQYYVWFVATPRDIWLETEAGYKAFEIFEQSR